MERILPRATALSEPYWQGCRDGVLRLQYCSACGTAQFYPRILCVQCGARELDWREASGRGRIAAFTVVRRAVTPAYEAPYAVALIDLEEGPRMMSNIVGCDPAHISVGQAVTIGFERWSDSITLPVFRLDPTEEKS